MDMGSCCMVTFQMLIMSNLEERKHDGWGLYSGSGQHWVMFVTASQPYCCPAFMSMSNMSLHHFFNYLLMILSHNSLSKAIKNPSFHATEYKKPVTLE